MDTSSFRSGLISGSGGCFETGSGTELSSGSLPGSGVLGSPGGSGSGGLANSSGSGGSTNGSGSGGSAKGSGSGGSTSGSGSSGSANGSGSGGSANGSGSGGSASGSGSGAGAGFGGVGHDAYMVGFLAVANLLAIHAKCHVEALQENWTLHEDVQKGRQLPQVSECRECFEAKKS